MHKVITVQISAIVLLIMHFLACGTVPIVPYPAPAPAPAPTPSQQPPSPDTLPPKVNITSAPSEMVEENSISFQWTGNDNNTPQSKLTYSYYLKGHDVDYSDFSSNTSKTYTELLPGLYTFYVKSRDKAGNISTSTSTTEITITVTQSEEDTIQNPNISSLLLVPGSEVNHIAVGSYGNVIYALDSINAQLYKSNNNGYGWTNISQDIAGITTWDALAIAPDNPDIIAIATDTGTEVYLSMDGGTNFAITRLAGKLSVGERIKCITISSSYGRRSRELAVGTSTGNGNGKIWINIFTSFPGDWQDFSTDIPGWLNTSPPSSGVDVFALEYSPSFISDGIILAIVASGPAPSGDTYLYLGQRDLAISNIIWNRLSGYPVEICQVGQDTPGTPLTCADLALPSDYTGTSISNRHVYACWSDNPIGANATGNTNDDVYRLDDTVCYRLQARPDAICSLAHYGDFSRGKLLAGAMMSGIKPSYPNTQIYFTSTPQSTFPIWQLSQKPPTGSYDAQVSWSPDGNTAYCGTSGGSSHDQSAFSISINNGFTWNQTGLIDT